MTRDQLDAIRARYPAHLRKAMVSMGGHAWDDAYTLLAEVERLRDAHAMAVQVSGELCEKCGWAMRFPGEKCRCELLAEAERLTVEVEAKVAQNVALIGQNGRLQQQVELVRLVRDAAFARGVAAMREAAAQHFSAPAPFDYVAPRIRALPDPEDTER